MISVELPDDMERDLEKRKEEGYYSSMAEVVREALREYLEKNKEKELTEKQEAMLKLAQQGKVGAAKVEGETKEDLKEGLQQLDQHRAKN